MQPHLADLAPALREFGLSRVRDAPQHSLSRTAAATLSLLEPDGPRRITAHAAATPALVHLTESHV